VYGKSQQNEREGKIKGRSIVFLGTKKKGGRHLWKKRTRLIGSLHKELIEGGILRGRELR